MEKGLFAFITHPVIQIDPRRAFAEPEALVAWCPGEQSKLFASLGRRPFAK